MRTPAVCETIRGVTYRMMIGVLLIVAVTSGCAAGAGAGVADDPSQTPAAAVAAARAAFPERVSSRCVDGAFDATWKCGAVWCDADLHVQVTAERAADFYRCWVHHPGVHSGRDEVCVVGQLRQLHVSNRRT